jgi:nucleoporin NUP42
VKYQEKKNGTGQVLSVYPTYQVNGNHWERIWFPDGNPGAYIHAEGRPAEYEGDKGAKLLEAFKAIALTGSFADGIMPDVPPKREWVRFDV